MSEKLVIKWSRILMSSIAQMNLKNSMLSERSETRDHVLYDSIYMKCPQEANLETKSRLVVAWGQSVGMV